MNAKEKYIAQDALDSMLRDSYMSGYRDGIEKRKPIDEFPKEAVEERICKNCKHYSEFDYSEFGCIRDANVKTDLIYGTKSLIGTRCEFERSSGGSCGPMGIHFEPIESTNTRIWKWIRSLLFSDGR